MKNNKILSLLAVAMFTANIANADFDLNLGVNSDAWASRSVVDSKARTDALEFDADNGKILKGSAVTTTSRTVSKLMSDLGAYASLQYCLVDDVYLGVRVGYTYDFGVAEGDEASVLVGDAEATKDLVDAEVALGTSGHYFPFLIDFKYDVAELMDDMNLYVTARGGALLGLARDKVSLTDTAVLNSDADGLDTTVAQVTTGMLGYMANAGVGLEYIGIQLELAYSMSMPSGFLGKKVEVPAVESKSTAYSFTEYRNVSAHAIKVSLGYRLKDLF